MNGPQTQAIAQYSLEESSSLASRYFEILDVEGQFRRHKANFLLPHRKDYYFFCLVRQGSSRHWVDYVPYTLQANRFYFTGPQQIQVKEKTEPLSGIMLSFTEEYLQLQENQALRQLPILENPEQGHELRLEPDQVQFLEDVLRKMLQEFAARHDWRNRMLHSYLNVLLIYLSRLYTGSFSGGIAGPDLALLKRFRAAIDQHFHRLHHVADYAELLHLTPNHLTDRIKQQSGKTAIQHIHERLMLEAKRQLFHTDRSVSEIAWQLGFEDASYFHRFFKRLEGKTPSFFRTSTREMYP
ncbi:helix-turn-helix transcriptional regulator [Larkinella knui]|uniref:AraC family transcriptional regulator n=1 Tax=Larkinella knui TaxID=2025310 RepID=A0A3P1CQT8_9BACT|nr:AraC family transcriptional regulator [Larkinella knui]RRB15618.1 AraC family transcriptional regulator [Larkinella knui]